MQTKKDNEAIVKRAYSSRNADKFVVRLPEGMRDRIGLRAKDKHRSMNSEIVAILTDVLEGVVTEPTQNGFDNGPAKETDGWIPQIGQGVIYQGKPDVLEDITLVGETFYGKLRKLRLAAPLTSLRPFRV